jgi:hypothetical protein
MTATELTCVAAIFFLFIVSDENPFSLKKLTSVLHEISGQVIEVQGGAAGALKSGCF